MNRNMANYFIGYSMLLLLFVLSSRISTSNKQGVLLLKPVYSFSLSTIVFGFMLIGCFVRLHQVLIPTISNDLFVLHIIIASLLIVQSIIDSLYYELPDEWNVCLVGLSGVYSIVLYGQLLPMDAVFLFLLIIVTFLITLVCWGSPGFGDAKLFSATALLTYPVYIDHVAIRFLSGLMFFILIFILTYLLMFIIGTIGYGISNKTLKGVSKHTLAVGPYWAIAVFVFFAWFHNH